ncbi:MAG TPA: cyclic nucleotide-binding domain-containing protein [Gemmatimonadota bacterium]|nr:cyclic nucleotide-binding domain-containing protein [Gemmatimonadota bacterium]
MAVLFGYFFFLMALQHLLKPARNAFFLSTAGSENLPWAYIVTAPASAVAALAYGRWLAGQPRRRQIHGSMAIVAGSLVLFRVLLEDATAWSAGAFYVWIQVFSLLLVSQFYLLGTDLFDPRQAKRIYGVIGAGGLLGGVAGAAMAGFLVGEVGADNLLWIGLALTVACAALAERTFRVGRFHTVEAVERPAGDPRRQPPVLGGFAILRRVPHLRRIAWMLFLSVVVSTFVDFLYNSAVEAAHPGDRERQAEFIGQSFAIFNVAALALQIFLTSWFLHTVGLAGAMLLLPVGLAVGLTGVLFIPHIYSAAGAKGADTAPRYSVDQAAREILYLPVPGVLKQRAKPFVDIVVQRAADGAAGIAILLLGSGLIALSTRGITLVTLVLVGVWIVVALGVRRTYRGALERLLAVRDVDLEQAVDASLDSAAMRELMRELRPEGEAERVRFALDLLAHLPSGVLYDEALALLEHPDPEVRLRAIEILEPGAGTTLETAVRPLVEDPDPRVRGRALVFLCRASPAEGLRRVVPHLESDEPHALEAALVCAIEGGGEEDAERAGRIVSRLVRQAGESAAPIRAAVARALGRLPGPHPLQRHLETLLADARPEVVETAIRAVGAVPRRDLLASLLPHLENRALRPAARLALAAYGEAGIPYLSAALRDPDLSPEVRRWIPGALMMIGSRAAYETIFEALPQLEIGRHRIYALKALNKMRRRHPSWRLGPARVRDEIDRELAASYHVERQLVTLEEARAAGEVPDRHAGPYEQALGHLARNSIERAFRLQGLVYAPRTIYFAYVGLTGGDTAYAANSLELLETVLDPRDAGRLIPLIDPDLTPRRRATIGREWYDLGGDDLAADLEAVLESGEPWLQAYAAPLAAAAFPDRLGGRLARLEASGPPLVRPLARVGGDEESMAMTSVEKAAALREAELLGQLGAEDLLQLAAVAEERVFEPGEAIFYEDEDGDYLYVILEGRVRVERGGREVFVAAAGDTIGTFSILDRRPRSASALAVERSRTLALHRADMGQILADNYSLVEGIFEYLTGIIRRMNEQVYSREAPEE